MSEGKTLEQLQEELAQARKDREAQNDLRNTLRAQITTIGERISTLDQYIAELTLQMQSKRAEDLRLTRDEAWIIFQALQNYSAGTNKITDLRTALASIFKIE